MLQPQTARSDPDQFDGSYACAIALGVVLDLLYAVDMVLHLTILGHYHDAELTASPSRIRSLYLHSAAFALDALALAPVNYVLLGATAGVREHRQLGVFARLLKFLKLRDLGDYTASFGRLVNRAISRTIGPYLASSPTAVALGIDGGLRLPTTVVKRLLTALYVPVYGA